MGQASLGTGVRPVNSLVLDPTCPPIARGGLSFAASLDADSCGNGPVTGVGGVAKKTKAAPSDAARTASVEGFVLAATRQRTVTRRLLAWFDRHGRDLPWRRNREPYRVWLSEVMLQQTQVERVCDYFVRFLATFPDVHALAAATEAEVLSAWQGLGYYRRARQLHACAKQIVSQHAGHFPNTVDELSALPGIGRYTASAIASIAFERSEPIIEANSRRVLARLVGYDQPLSGSSTDLPLWEIARNLVPKQGAGLFNQALMDLGAMVCRPTAPSCHACPLATACTAFHDGRTDELPRMAKPRASVALDEVALVITDGTRVLLVQRGDGEWWTGLWDFPRAAPPLGPLLRVARREGRLLGEVRYGVTHHRVRVDVVQVATERPTVVDRAFPAFAKEPAAVKWHPLSRLAQLAMPSPARRIAELVVPLRARQS